MAKMLLKYFEAFTDRFGKPRYYFRRARKRIPLPGPIGSAAFMAAYQAALDGISAPKIGTGVPRAAPGTVNWLVGAYLSSSTFTTLAPETQRTRRNILENFRKADGDKPIFCTVNGEPLMVLARHNLQAIVNKKRSPHSRSTIC